MSHLPGGRPPPPPPPSRRPPDRDGKPHPVGDPAWPPGPGRDGAKARDAFPVPFSVADGFVAVLLLLIAQIVVVIPVMLFGIVDVLAGGAPLLLVVITAQAVGLAAALGWLALRQRLSWRLLGPRRPKPGHLFWGIGLGIAGFFGVNLVILSLLQLVGPVDPPEQQVLQEVAAGGLTTLLAAIAAVVMAPIMEEIIFRGVLFQALKRRAGLWPAAIISGVLFAAVHVELTQPLFSSGVFLLGVGFALALHRTGSLLVPIVGHAVYNLIVVLVVIQGGTVIDTL